MEKVCFSAKILKLPNLCCSCGIKGAEFKYIANTSRKSGKRIVKIQSKSWSFPICSKCLIWINADNNQRIILKIFFFGILFCLIYLLINYSLSNLLIIICILIFVGIFWKTQKVKANDLKPNSNCFNPPIEYLGWDGSIHIFSIYNADFKNVFIKLNEKKIIND